MKMLCIRGRQHRCHTGLVAGQVYEVDILKICHETRALAQGVVWTSRWPVGFYCTCGHRFLRSESGAGELVPWGPDRFVPWDESLVSEKDVEELFRPAPAPVDVDA